MTDIQFNRNRKTRDVMDSILGTHSIFFNTMITRDRCWIVSKGYLTAWKSNYLLILRKTKRMIYVYFEKHAGWRVEIEDLIPKQEKL